MKKKITAMVLSLLMVFSVLPISAMTVFAEETGAPIATEIPATYDWYSENEKTYILDSLGDLVGLAKLTQGAVAEVGTDAAIDFAGKTVSLAADLTLSDQEYWYFNDGATVYDYQIKKFAGSFLGGEHTIKGLKVYASVKPATTVGLFGSIAAEGSIRDLTLDTVTASFCFPTDTLYRGSFGFIAYNLNGAAENCRISNAKVTTNAYSALREGGAMFCNVNGSAVDCIGENITYDINYDGINLNYYSIEDIGGLFGTVAADGEAVGCKATNVVIDVGDAGYTKKVGGFTGKTYGGAALEGCSAEDVTLKGYYLYYAGGFVGHCEKGNGTLPQTIADCKVSNVSLTTIRSAKIVGGFVGEAANGTAFQNCDADGVTMNIATGVADGSESSKSQGAFAGFAGQTNSSSTPVVFDGCDLTRLQMTVAGDLEGAIGAFIASTGSSVEFKECSAEGSINAENTEADDAVGGFIGNLGWGGSPEIVIDKSSSAVDITANGPAGGFVGKADSNNSSATPVFSVNESVASGNVTSLNSTANAFVATGTKTDALTGNTATGTVTTYPAASIGENEYLTLAEALEAAKSGDTVLLLKDISLQNWSSVDIRTAMVIDGNGKTISGLTAPLINNASADLEIKNLTITGANISITSAAGVDNDTSAAALVQWANSGSLCFTDVSVKSSTIKGDGYVAAFVGFVDSPSAGVSVSGGSIENVTLIAGGTVGAVAGHTYADITVSGITVSSNTLTSNSDGGTRPDKVGLVVGRLNADTVSISATVNGTTNTITPAGESNAHRVIGSIPGGTAVITGGSYPTDPTITGKAGQTIAIEDGYELKQSADGSYTVAAGKEFVVTVDKAECVVGETVSVSVILNGTDLVGAEWTLVYDSDKFELLEGDINGYKIAGTNITFADSELLATYTFRVKVQAPDAAEAFTLTATDAWNIEEATAGDGGTPGFIRPADVTIVAPDYLVEVGANDYVAGKKLILVYTNSEVISFTYAGAKMYDVSTKYQKAGYTQVFAVVVDAIDNGVSADYEANVAILYEAVSSAYVIVYDRSNINYDLNGTGEFNLRDVTVAFGVYNNTDSIFAEYMNIVLNTDVDANGVVDGLDTAAFVQAYNNAN